MNKLGCAALAALLSFDAVNGQSAVLYAFEETGAGVVGTLSGSLDLTGADPFDSGGSVSGARVIPIFGEVVNMGGSVVRYTISGPDFFGAGDLTDATSADGSVFAVDGLFSVLSLPEGYAGGAPLAGGVTFAGATFASLGIRPGEYVYTLPNDTVTVRFVIPLPATLPLLLGALGLTLAAARRRA